MNENIRKLYFVFGSNLAGRHGKGAALFAKQHYSAEQGVGVGITGRSYAIPTKDENLNVLPLSYIEEKIVEFLNYAKLNTNDRFLLTPVGSGLAGYKKRDIWSILKKHGVPDNVYLASTWVND